METIFKEGVVMKKTEIIEFKDVVATSKIEATKAQNHAMAFAPSMQKYHEIASKLSELNRENPSADDAKIARRARLDLVPIRTAAGIIKDDRKAMLITEANLIQSLYNVVKNTCELTEAEFLEIEKHQERKEAAEREKLKQARIEKLAKFEIETEFIDLAAMTEEQFTKFYNGQKLAFETKKEQEKQAELDRIEAEKKAELSRKRSLELTPYYGFYNANDLDLGTISQDDYLSLLNEAKTAKEAKEKADEETRLENERLKKEAEQREKQLEAERKKLAEEQAKKDAEAKAEQERLSKIAQEEKAKADKLQADLDEEKSRIEAEEREKIAKEKALLLAPDKEKVKVFFEKFKNLEFPNLQSEAGIKMTVRVNDALQMVKKLIIEDSKTLL